MAARRVAEENKQLRELLNRYGFSGEYIAHYLQSGTVSPLDAGRGQPFHTGDPGTSVQSLQQLLIPRRAAGLDQNVPFPLPSQSSREDSIASASTASSSVWESTQGTMAPYGHHQQISVAPAVMGSSGHPQYSSPAFSGDAAAVRQNSFPGPPPPSMLSDPRQAIVTTQPMSMDGHPAMNYHYSMSPYNDATARGYGPPGGERPGLPGSGC